VGFFHFSEELFIMDATLTFIFEKQDKYIIKQVNAIEDLIPTYIATLAKLPNENPLVDIWLDCYKNNESIMSTIVWSGGNFKSGSPDSYSADAYDESEPEDIYILLFHQHDASVGTYLVTHRTILSTFFSKIDITKTRTVELIANNKLTKIWGQCPDTDQYLKNNLIYCCKVLKTRYDLSRS
jgi:hypothetical protein